MRDSSLVLHEMRPIMAEVQVLWPDPSKLDHNSSWLSWTEQDMTKLAYPFPAHSVPAKDLCAFFHPSVCWSLSKHDDFEIAHYDPSASKMIVWSL